MFKFVASNSIKKLNTEIINLPNEEWKPVKGFEGLYEISNKGRLKRVSRDVLDQRGIIQHFPEQLIKGTLSVYGYMQTTLRKNRRKINVRIHKLVAEAFIENPNNKPIVDHIDGNKVNNNADNLRWVTNSENIRNENTYPRFREIVVNLRKSECIEVYQLDDNYNIIRNFNNAEEAAKFVGCTPSSIRQACKPNHKHYKVKGYHWRY